MSSLLYNRKTGIKRYLGILIIDTTLIIWSRTDRLLTDLIIASINTGSLTALLAVAVIIVNIFYSLSSFHLLILVKKVCLATSSKKLIYGGPYFMLPTVYINSVLGNLNIRNSIRSKGFATSIAAGVSSLRFHTKNTTEPEASDESEVSVVQSWNEIGSTNLMTSFRCPVPMEEVTMLMWPRSVRQEDVVR